MTDEEFMREALLEAEAAGQAGEVPVGAVAECGGIIAARARNRMVERKRVDAHAEFELMHALCEARGDWRLEDVTVYITKEPCLMCTGMLVNARVKRIVFGLGDPAGGGCGGAFTPDSLPGLLWHPEIKGGVLAEESGSLLREFFRTVRKKNKKSS